MSIEVIRADVAPVTIITILTVTDRLHAHLVKITSLCIRVTAGPSVWTATLPTRYLVVPKLRAAIEPNLTLLTKISNSIVPAVDTVPCLWVAGVSMTITLALLTNGEVPIAWLALVTLPAKCWLLGVTSTLPCLLVTELILRAKMMTVTTLASRTTKPKCSRSTTFALSSNHQSLTLASTIIFVAHTSF